jgi:hypothetical protein
LRLDCSAGGNVANSLHPDLMRDGKRIKEKGQIDCLLCDALGKSTADALRARAQSVKRQGAKVREESLTTEIPKSILRAFARYFFFSVPSVSL